MSAERSVPVAAPPPLLLPIEKSGRRTWLVACAFVFALTALFCLHLPTARSLFELWADTAKTTYTHGFVIAALAAWLVVRHRERLGALPWRPDLRAALALLPLGFAWLVAVRAGVELIHQVLLVSILWLAVGAAAGLRQMRELTVPVGFLAFALPVWDQINGVLQAITIVATTFLLKVAGVPAFVDGSVVHLAVGTFEIEGGCSGLHFFIVGLTLATLYGELGNDRWRDRAKFVALAATLAMISNWLRVTIIVIAGHLTNMQHYLVRVEHYWFGWGMFALTMVAFFLIARRIAPPASDPVHDGQRSPAIARAGLGMSIGIAIACLAPVVEVARPLTAARLDDSLLPGTPAGWTRLDDPAPWHPQLTGVDRFERATFVSSGRAVDVLVASYSEQHQNKELVSYGNEIVTREDGRIVSDVRVPGTGRELVVARDGARSLVRYVFDIGGRRTDRELAAQLLYGIAAIRGATPSSIIALRTACAGEDCSDARRRLDEFAAVTHTALRGSLPSGEIPQ